MDEKTLFDIGIREFDGKEGPRREYIYRRLKSAGLRPHEDEYGNIYAFRGGKGKYRLYSSHMDIDKLVCPPATPPEFAYEPRARSYKGVMDNAVGCYINLMAALSHRSDNRALYVFTASEEENPETLEFAISAHDAIKFLKSYGIEPELSVAVDVTYPRLITPVKDSQELYDIWDDHKYEDLFDINDQTRVYVDGFTREDSKKIAKKLEKSYRGIVKVRDFDFAGWDESYVYSSISPAFAVGPVGFGKYDEPNQSMPKVNIESAYYFLKHIVRSDLVKSHDFSL